MNHKQNQRIMQLDIATLIVGVDIAKEVHVARSQDFRGIELAKPLSFSSKAKGFQQLLFWIRQTACQHGKSKIVCGMEPTGHYWLTLAQFLRKKGIRVVLVNPLHVKKSKELDDNSPTKNDVKDARVIARLVQDGRFTEPNLPEGVYAELRTGMNLRERLTETASSLKGRIHNWLDRYHPEFFTVFSDWEKKAAFLTLKYFPLPEDIVKLGVEGITSIWRQKGMQRVSAKRAQLLVKTAAESVGLTEGQIMAKQELQLLLQQFELICQQLDELMKQIEQLLANIPEAAPMMSIPGAGLVTVAGFLSEVGDLSRYSHPRQIQKLAGLNLKENSSGKHKGKTTIAKRGRPRLRSLLFKCVMVLVTKNQEFKKLHQEYVNRKQSPLTKKQSLIALCCKLIRIFFGVGQRKTFYDPKRVIPQGFLSAA
jgi:transposase